MSSTNRKPRTAAILALAHLEEMHERFGRREPGVLRRASHQRTVVDALVPGFKNIDPSHVGVYLHPAYTATKAGA